MGSVVNSPSNFDILGAEEGIWWQGLVARFFGNIIAHF